LGEERLIERVLFIAELRHKESIPTTIVGRRGKKGAKRENSGGQIASSRQEFESDF